MRFVGFGVGNGVGFFVGNGVGCGVALQFKQAHEVPIAHEVYTLPHSSQTLIPFCFALHDVMGLGLSLRIVDAPIPRQFFSDQTHCQ